MKPYAEYKDTLVDWLGKIPSHWETKRFKHLFSIKKDIAGSLGFNVLSITQQGIKVKNIESGEGQISSDYTKYQKVNIGDFAMNHMDLLTGFVDISKFDGVTSPDYRVFTLEDNTACKEYYLYLLQLGYSNKIFYPLGQGAAHIGRWRLPADSFKEFRAPYPPYQEQLKIVNFLRREIGRIDSLIAEKNNFLDLLKEKRHALVHEAMSNSKTVKLRIQHCCEIVSRPIDRDDEQVYSPVGLYNRGRGIFHKKPTKGRDLGDSEFFYIKPGDLILSGQFSWEGAVAVATNMEEGCVVSHRYPVLRGKKGIINTNYLWAYLTTQAGDFLLNEHSRGAAGRNRPLNINTLSKEKIPVPPLDAQTKVVKIVLREQELKLTIKESEILLKEHRKALIEAAVTGKIDVREGV